MTPMRFLLCICVASVATPVACAQAAQPDTQIRVAVVDVDKVFNQWERRAQEEAKLKAEIESINGELRSLRHKMEDLHAERESLNPGSARRDELEKEIYQIQTEVELLKRLTEIELTERMTEATRMLYNDIRREVKDYAVRNGYHLVLKYDSGDIDVTNPADLKVKINARQVLYFAPAMDITQAILEQINKK